MYFHCTLCSPVTVIMQPSKTSVLWNFSLIGCSMLVLSLHNYVLPLCKCVSAALKDQYRKLLRLHRLVWVFLNLVSAKLLQSRWLKGAELNLLHFLDLSLPFPPVNFDFSKMSWFDVCFPSQKLEHKANVCYFYQWSQIPCSLAAFHWQKNYSKIIRACKWCCMSL